MTDPNQAHDLIDDRTARLLIERALERHEANANLIRVADLRAALAELGVSAADFDAARQELTIGGSIPERPLLVNVLRTATAGVAVGSVSAALIATIRGDYPIGLAALVLATMLSGAYALRARGLRHQLGFQLRNTTLWASLSASAAVVSMQTLPQGHVWSWGPFVSLWVVTSAVGLIASLRGRPATGSQPTGGAPSTVRRLIVRGLRWITRKIDPQLRLAVSAPRT